MLIAIGAKDDKFRVQLGGLLKGAGHTILELMKKETALATLRSAKPALLIVASGEGCGAVEFITSVRAQSDLRLLPVLSIDPKANSSETVALLDAGADDAITRSFQPPIFLARVRTLLRRVAPSVEAPEETVAVLAGGPIQLKLISRHATVGGKPVELTRLEFDLLAHLLKHPDKAFKRDELLAAVWNYPGNVETRTLDKHVESLRRKAAPAAEMIQTVHGVGYRFSPGVSARR